MKKIKKPDFLLIDDPAERKKAITEALKALDEKGVAAGEPPISHRDIHSRYTLSCSIIFVTTVLATVILALSALYYTTLPKPYSYVSTQAGKLYEIKPFRIEK